MHSSKDLILRHLACTAQIQIHDLNFLNKRSTISIFVYKWFSLKIAPMQMTTEGLFDSAWVGNRALHFFLSRTLTSVAWQVTNPGLRLPCGFEPCCQRQLELSAIQHDLNLIWKGILQLSWERGKRQYKKSTAKQICVPAQRSARTYTLATITKILPCDDMIWETPVGWWREKTQPVWLSQSMTKTCTCCLLLL